jgi:curved DNA-binding protein CbpA
MNQKKATDGAIEIVGKSASGDSFYDLMNLRRDASDAEVREAFSYAIDRAGNDPPLIAQLHRAFDTLRHPLNRKRYDDWLDKSAQERKPFDQAEMPPGSHYALLKIARSADSGMIQRAWRDLIAKCHPDAGGSDDLAAQANLAYEVLSDPHLRERYDAELDRDKPPPRWTVTGFRDKIPVHTDSRRDAFRYQGRTALTVVDNRPGEPGGLDEPMLGRFKVTIPKGRRWAQLDRIDSFGCKWVKGVAFFHAPIPAHIHALQYDIEDRGDGIDVEDDGSDTHKWCGDAAILNGRPGGNALRTPADFGTASGPK